MVVGLLVTGLLVGCVRLKTIIWYEELYSPREAQGAATRVIPKSDHIEKGEHCKENDEQSMKHVIKLSV